MSKLLDGEIYLGVDGGNSKTIALAANAKGEILGSAQSAGSDIYMSTGPERAIDEICSAVRGAYNRANIEASTPVRAAFNLAGADWPEDFAFLYRELEARINFICPPIIVNDFMGALRSEQSDGVGIAVTCGTGAAIGARNFDGRMFHLGFWPDPGGGEVYGSEALRAVYRAGLGLDSETLLSSLILERFKATDAVDLMHKLTRRNGNIPCSEIQELAHLVLDAADSGDPVAKSIVVQNAIHLSAQAKVAAKKVGLKPEGATLVLTGGLLKHPSTLIHDTISKEMPQTRIIRSTHEPVLGALLLAYDGGGVSHSTGSIEAAYLREVSTYRTQLTVKQSLKHRIRTKIKGAMGFIRR